MSDVESTSFEASLVEWKKQNDEHIRRRDPLVRASHSAGIKVNRIHTLTGVARSTIYRIIDADPAGAHTSQNQPPRRPA